LDPPLSAAGGLTEYSDVGFSISIVIRYDRNIT
jgi:hypothetical protein